MADHNPRCVYTTHQGGEHVLQCACGWGLVVRADVRPSPDHVEALHDADHNADPRKT